VRDHTANYAASTPTPCRNRPHTRLATLSELERAMAVIEAGPAG